MIRFLIKGLLRDRNRSLFPVIIVTAGVALTVFLHAYITGFMGDTIEMNARFSSGHLKVLTRALAEKPELQSADVGLTEVSSLREALEQQWPGTAWVPRISFGAMIDVPDAEGNTRAQGIVSGMALEAIGHGEMEAERLGLQRALTEGRLPEHPSEALVSHTLAQRLQLKPGDQFTLIGNDAFGSMAMANFQVSGTIRFGTEALDRGMVVCRLDDAQAWLRMDDGATTLLGFLPGGFYHNKEALAIAHSFNELHDSDDEYAPFMQALSQQGTLGQYVLMSETWSFIISLIFVLAMALVLWNAGLLAGLRRYGEMGLRLAIGEEKRHVYWTLVLESVVIGLIGSVSGTLLGLFFAWLLQTYGLDISGMMQGAAVMFPDVIRARITPADYYIGFLPGILSTALGAMLAGLAIFRRQTANLFKELEVV
ncbi:MAG: FtsX-like permease family protein [Bacteroidetes bacterium]|nr:FtsX-like permease family protein [Bacteroidota bacterium]